MRLLAIALLAVIGCTERDVSPPTEAPAGPPPVTDGEKRRGLAACADYKARVCACAERQAQHAGDCRMADSRISALELSLRIAAAETDSESDGQALAITNARKIMRRCIEQAAELARGCPQAEAEN